MKNNCSNVIAEIEYMLHTRSVLKAKGPHFRIFHKLHVPGTTCAPGEEIAGISVMGPVQEEAIPMSLAMLLVFDRLARHSHLPQLAVQIVRGIERDPFCQQHGRNASSHTRLVTKISLSELKVYFQRIKLALERAFRKAGIPVDPGAVLVKEETQSNRAAWRLKASVEWVHVDGQN